MAGNVRGWRRVENQLSWINAMKEVSLLEMIGRSLAKVAAGAGVAAVLIWLTYVMLDITCNPVSPCLSPVIDLRDAGN